MNLRIRSNVASFILTSRRACARSISTITLAFPCRAVPHWSRHAEMTCTHDGRTGARANARTPELAKHRPPSQQSLIQYYTNLFTSSYSHLPRHWLSHPYILALHGHLVMYPNIRIHSCTTLFIPPTRVHQECDKVTVLPNTIALC